MDLTYLNLPKAGGVAAHDHPESHRVFGLHDGRLRNPQNPDHIAEDLELHKQGILDGPSLLSGYQRQSDPLRLLVHDKHGRLKAVRHSHNLRLNTGGVWMCELMGGGLNLGTTGQATAISGTSLTAATTTAPTAGQYVGHIICAQASATVGVYGKIVSHTTTTTPVFTVDQWYLLGSATGAAGTTPTATTTYTILPGRGFAPWIAFTTTGSFTPSSIDVQGSGWANEVTTGGMARQFGTYSLTTNPTGTSGSNVSAAFKFHLAITVSGTLTGVDGAGLFEYAVAANGNPTFEGALSSFSVISGDSVTLDWTFQNN